MRIVVRRLAVSVAVVLSVVLASTTVSAGPPSDALRAYSIHAHPEPRRSVAAFLGRD